MSRFRLYPSPTQEAALLDHCAHARFVWNLGLEQRLMWRPGRGSTPGYAEQCRQLTEARVAESWLAAGSVTVQQSALRDLDGAWRRFFGGTARRPTWRKQGQHEGLRIVGSQATRVRQDGARWSSVLVPKVGWVRFRRTREVTAWRSYRVTRDRAGRWHVAFAVQPEPITPPGTGEVVGVDRGVTVAATLSTGEMTSPTRLRPKEAERLVRLQRRLARAQPGSGRRARAKLQAAGLYAREADRRKDWVEKTSTSLARRFDLIRVEDLAIGRMTKRGRNKRGLNRAILASGWGLLVRRLEDKAPGRVQRVSPAYTSQTCNACGHCAAESRKSQAVFACVACGHRANADINAARNIAAGRAVTGRGGRGAQARPAKRQLRPA